MNEPEQSLLAQLLRSQAELTQALIAQAESNRMMAGSIRDLAAALADTEDLEPVQAHYMDGTPR